MRKIGIITISAILVFGLVGCNKSKQLYLSDATFDITTCGEDCLYEEGTQAIRWMEESLKDNSEYNYHPEENFEFSFLGGNGETHLRTALNSTYTIGGKYRENYLGLYEGFSRPISFMSIYWDECKDTDTCESKFLGTDIIKNLEYGFTESSGYLNFDIYDKDDNILYMYKMSYKVVNEDLEYQYYYMDFILDQPTYIEYRDGIYKNYFTWRNGTKIYTYVNTNTDEYITQSFFEGSETSFYYYNPNNGIGYQHNYRNTDYAVFLIDNDNTMFAVSSKEDKYYADINFYNMQGWDSVEDYIKPNEAPNDEVHIWGQYKLYNGSIRVFEDYIILGHHMSSYYDGIYGLKELTLEEIKNYELPDEFMYDVDEKDVTSSFLEFIDLEDKTEVLPYDPEDILNFYEELKTIY